MGENSFLNVKNRLAELSTVKITNDRDLLQFFSKINSIIKEIGLYCDVASVKNEVKELVEDYLKFGGVDATIQYDAMLYLDDDVPATEISVTLITEKGEEETHTADIVLQCDIELHGNYYNISPQVFFVIYEKEDNEGEEVVGEKYEYEMVDGGGESMDFSEFSDEEEEETGEEDGYDPEFADDEVIKDFLRNMIVSKIYEEGYEYPNDETIEELVEKIFNQINDTLEQNLNIYVNDDEEEETKEQKKKKDSTFNLEDDGIQRTELKGGDVLEIYEKEEPKYYFIVTARNGSGIGGKLESFIAVGDSEKDALENFAIEHGPSWVVQSVLKIEKHELFNED